MSNSNILETIEKSTISNVCLAARLLRLVSKHCTHRNEREYGRTVDLAREWFVKYPYDGMDTKQQMAFIGRKDVGLWTEVLISWCGWEGFLHRMMEETSAGGVIKAFLLYKCVALRDTIDHRVEYDYQICFLHYIRNGIFIDRFMPTIDREFYDHLTKSSGKSDSQILMECDIMGYEWTWEMVELLVIRRENSILEKLVCHKLDDLLKVALPHEIAKLTITRPDHDLEGVMRMVVAISERYPTAYQDVYRKYWKSLNESV